MQIFNCNTGDIAARSLLTDFLPRVGNQELIEAHLGELIALAEKQQLPMHIWQFTELNVTESLQQHVRSANLGLCVGPRDKVRDIIGCINAGKETY
jgi:hypothetical protein